jgi:hypothetical protein
MIKGISEIAREENEEPEEEVEQLEEIQLQQQEQEPPFFSWSDKKLNLQLIDIWKKHSSEFSSGRYRKNQVYKTQ